MEFSKRLSQLRNSNNMTTSALAEKLNVSRSTISLWESGKRTPDYKTIIELCNIFNITSDYLLGLEDDSNSKLIDVLDINNISEYENIHIKQLNKIESEIFMYRKNKEQIKNEIDTSMFELGKISDLLRLKSDDKSEFTEVLGKEKNKTEKKLQILQHKYENILYKIEQLSKEIAKCQYELEEKEHKKIQIKKSLENTEFEKSYEFQLLFLKSFHLSKINNVDIIQLDENKINEIYTALKSYLNYLIVKNFKYNDEDKNFNNYFDIVEIDKESKKTTKKNYDIVIKNLHHVFDTIILDNEFMIKYKDILYLKENMQKNDNKLKQIISYDDAKEFLKMIPKNSTLYRNTSIMSKDESIEYAKKICNYIHSLSND